MNVNIWLVLRDDAQAAIKERLTWDEEAQGAYDGPVMDRSARLFRFMQQHKEQLFKTATIGGRVYTLWSITFSVSGSVASKIASELEYLTTEYPNRIIVVGAWTWESGDMACRQVGTTLTIDTRIVNKLVTFKNPDYQPDPELPNFDDRPTLSEYRDVEETYVSGSTGTPTYPLHPRLIDLMPDVDDLGTRPTEVSDVNLLFGQPPRSFV